MSGSDELPSNAGDRLSLPSSLRSAFGDVPCVAAPRAAIVEAGEACHHIFLLASGWSYRERRAAPGRRAILDVYMPGDVMGLDHLLGERALDRIVALTVARYQCLDRSALDVLLRRSDVARHLMLCFAAEKARLDQHATRLSRLPAIERLAAGLVHLYERASPPRSGESPSHSSGAAISLPLTLHHLADYLGLSIVHVTRTVRTLRDEGLVEVRNADLIVRDPARLRAIARVDLTLA
jgi:CRP/FNR family transcriptional regulator